jgi:Mg-chelatase subunit ChlD
MKHLITMGVVLAMAAGAGAQGIDAGAHVVVDEKGNVRIVPNENELKNSGTRRDALRDSNAPLRSPSLLAGYVMKGYPTKPDALDANATGQQRLEWVAAMQQWKKAHAAWTKRVTAKWSGKKVRWILVGWMDDSADANSVAVLALIPAVYRGKDNASARDGLAEVVLGGCQGPAAAMARKAADPNKNVPALDVRAVIDRIEVVCGKRTDANTPARRVRITLKQCDLRLPPPDWQQLRMPIKSGKGPHVARQGKAVKFYGVKTKATHAVYLLDASGSMAMGGVFGSIARETVASAVRLNPSQRLAVIVSNGEGLTTYPGKPFASATETAKEGAVMSLDKVRPQGQADMLAALKDGLGRAGKEAKADKTSIAIYLVSDGVFTGKKVAAKAVKLIKEARKKNSCIEVHALLLGKRPKKQDPSYKQMKAIAEAGGGKFKIVRN